MWWLPLAEFADDSESALRQILARYVDAPAASLSFRLGVHGKPELLSPDKLSFNLSHSGDYAICLVADGAPVGADLERMAPIKDALTVAEQLFSQDEYFALRDLAPDESLALFYRLWVQREAVVKAAGLGFAVPPESISLSTQASTGQWVTLKGQGDWWVAPIPAPPGYAAAGCASGPFSTIVRRPPDFRREDR